MNLGCKQGYYTEWNWHNGTDFVLLSIIISIFGFANHFFLLNSFFLSNNNKAYVVHCFCGVCDLCRLVFSVWCVSPYKLFCPTHISCFSTNKSNSLLKVIATLVYPLHIKSRKCFDILYFKNHIANRHTSLIKLTNITGNFFSFHLLCCNSKKNNEIIWNR